MIVLLSAPFLWTKISERLLVILPVVCEQCDLKGPRYPGFNAGRSDRGSRKHNSKQDLCSLLLHRIDAVLMIRSGCEVSPKKVGC